MDSDVDSGSSWHTTECTAREHSSMCDNDNEFQENENRLNESSELFGLRNAYHVNVPDYGNPNGDYKGHQSRPKNRPKWLKEIGRAFPYQFPWMIFAISAVQVKRQPSDVIKSMNPS